MVNCVECGAPLAQAGESCGACGAELTPGTINGKEHPQLDDANGLVCEDPRRDRADFPLHDDDLPAGAHGRPAEPSFVSQPRRDDPPVVVARFAAAPAREDEGPRPAGFASRGVAMAIDLFILFCLGPVLLALGTSAVMLAERVTGQRVGTAVDLLRSSLSAGWMTLIVGYFSVLHARSGQTLGKVAMRIKVQEVGGARVHIARSVLRTFGYALSTVGFGVGFLLALGPAGRALHDRLAGTVVVRERRGA